MTDQMLPKGYRTWNGRILTDAEVAYYNRLTAEIAEQGRFNAGYVEKCRDSRHKVIAGLLAPDEEGSK